MSSSFFGEKSLGFWDAAKTGDLPLVKSLSLDSEVNLNRKNVNGCTPFYFACRYGHVDIVRYLLDFHDNQRDPIDYNLADNCGYTPISIACQNGFEKVVEMLVADEGIDVNRANEDERTPFYWASLYCHVGVVKMMLASGKRIVTLKKDRRGKSAADIAGMKAERTFKFPSEFEEIFQQEKRKGFLIASLIESYERNPEATRAKLRRELGSDERSAGGLFALVVFLSDGYLEIPEIQAEDTQTISNAKRFFRLASSLPLDLQMVLCNRSFGLGSSIVKKIHSEEGFKKFARE